ncbi:hypothetical protein SLEP1_g59179 [Rubroshorea leprosula]|uniref:Uncharacterized protein n=1 Tax=Rubroshorea leprosula TaxID=152421 RepID=A0AAV5MT46_9ROSI|nr:hypothetical protein SLEP1_g59179 [Rubroshorea leprosula]
MLFSCAPVRSYTRCAFSPFLDPTRPGWDVIRPKRGWQYSRLAVKAWWAIPILGQSTPALKTIISNFNALSLPQCNSVCESSVKE